MSQTANDLRVTRSRKFLRDALIDLIEERGFDALTVGEITERAMVSRATFYRNYQDKYDLVEQIFDESIQTLKNTLAEVGHAPQMMEWLFAHIAEYERLYRALLGRKGSPWFVRRMHESLIDLIHGWQHASGQSLYPPSDTFVPNLLAAMLVEAVTWWLEHGRPCTPQEMNRRCILLSTAIFKETGTWE